MGILYDYVIESPYCKSREVEYGSYEIAYKEGTQRTIDWGHRKRKIVVGRDVLPYGKKEMLKFLKNKDLI